MGLQNTNASKWHDDALLLLSDWCVCIEVKYLQYGLTKYKRTQWHDQSTESPIFDAPFWSENGVSCPQCGHERNKIGDSVLWTRRCACIFVKYLQDGFTKYKRTQWHADALLFVGTMRVFLSKLFPRWVYKIQTHAMTRRCVAFVVDWCVCIEVNYLQDGFTKYKRTRWHDDALLLLWIDAFV